MPLEELQFGGLASLYADERIPITASIDASDCYLDDGAIRGRNGYRNALAALVSASPQGIWRFRPTANTVRTVVVANGHIYTITDPSTETASDGVKTDLGAKFGSGDKISGVQLGKYLYLSNDQATNVLWRVKPDFSVEQISVIPKGLAPTVALSSLSVTKFLALFGTANEILVGAPVLSTVGTDWRNVQAVTGEGVIYVLPADLDLTAYNWVDVMMTPDTYSQGGGSVDISVATAAGGFEKILGVTDSPGPGSPSLCSCPLTGLTTATRSAVRRFKFVLQGTPAANFGVHGFMSIPSAPGAGPQSYFTDFYDSASKQQSQPSDLVVVNFDATLVSFPTFHSYRRDYSGYADGGLVTTDPDAVPSEIFFNKGSGIAYAQKYEFASIPTFSGNAPIGTFDTLRLWRVASNGTRLVKTKAVASGAAYTITDDRGASSLASTLYVAGGPPVPCVAMGARAGRLAMGGDPTNPNRVSISNFVPFGQDSDPFPQFSPIPLLTSDGVAFDLGPSASEQVLWIGNGDALYIGTNEAMYGMSDLTPSGEPYKIAERGVIGRRAAIYCDLNEMGAGVLCWAAHDGVYLSWGRMRPQELSKDIRRLYKSWLVPDSTTVMAYQDRKLYIIRGIRVLRYDFVLNMWTRHTLANIFLHSVCYRDPSGTLQQMWLLDSNGNVERWQAAATTDDGVTIPAWTFSTGFAVEGVKSRLKWLFLDTSGATPITASLYKSAAGTPLRSISFASSGEHEETLPPDMQGYKWRLGLTGANGTAVRRAMWEREVTVQRGG